MELSKKVRSTKKRFGPAEVHKVPVQMTTRSQILLLNSDDTYFLTCPITWAYNFVIWQHNEVKSSGGAPYTVKESPKWTELNWWKHFINMGISELHFVTCLSHVYTDIASLCFAGYLISGIVYRWARGLSGVPDVPHAANVSFVTEGSGVGVSSEPPVSAKSLFRNADSNVNNVSISHL